MDLAATPDLRVIFIILLIALNLHDSSLSESDCNTGSKNIIFGSGYKVKKKNQHKKKTNEEKKNKLIRLTL